MRAAQENKKSDLRVLRTLSAIETVFITLLKQKTFSEITIKEIASGAQINKNTFYLHYRDKEDLLDALCKKHLLRFRSCFEQEIPINSIVDTDACLKDCLNNVVDMVNTDLDFYLALINDRGLAFYFIDLKQTLVDYWHHVFLEYSNKVKKEKYLYAEYLAAGIVGLIFEWVRHYEEYTIDEVKEYLYRIHSRDYLILIDDYDNDLLRLRKR